MSCQDVDRDLDSYVDRELDPATAAAVRDHLAGCAACRQRVGEREILGRLIRSAPFYPASDGLRARVSARTTRATRWVSVRRTLTWAAAAVLIVSVGGMALIRSTASRPDPTVAMAAMIDDVVDGHVRSLMAEHLFDVRSTDQHTVKPWFLGKLDFSPPVVDLASIGFPLVGGRLDYLGGQPAAALVYQRQKHTINVIVTAERNGAFAATDARTVRGFHVRHWSHDRMSFWAVSDLNDAELTEFVNAIRVASTPSSTRQR